jgi:FkbM family methyltransferase
MKHVKDVLSTRSTYAPSNFIEIGSMDAADAVSIMEMFSMLTDSVYVVEASPRRHKEIVSSYPYLNVTQCAIWTYDGFIEFNDVVEESGGLNKGMGSIRDRGDGVYAKGSSQKTVVPCMRASTWLGGIQSSIKEDMHFVKIDAEGCDLEVLLSFDQYLKNIRCVQLEGQKRVIWKDQRTQKDIDEIMPSLGYTEVWRREWTNAFDTMWLREDLFM